MCNSLLEKKMLVGAMGIEKNPTPIKPCKQWCCNRSYWDNHYKNYNPDGFRYSLTRGKNLFN